MIGMAKSQRKEIRVQDMIRKIYGSLFSCQENPLSLSENREILETNKKQEIRIIAIKNIGLVI